MCSQPYRNVCGLDLPICGWHIWSGTAFWNWVLKSWSLMLTLVSIRIEMNCRPCSWCQRSGEVVLENTLHYLLSGVFLKKSINLTSVSKFPPHFQLKSDRKAREDSSCLFPSLMSIWCGKILVSSALLEQSLRTGLVMKNRKLWAYFKMAIFLSLQFC